MRRAPDGEGTPERTDEKELRQGEERYQTFIEQSTEGIWRFELQDPVAVDLSEDAQIERFYRHAYLAECNYAMARMYGFSRPEEIVGARLGDLLPRSVPENVEYLRAFIRSGYRLTDAESQEVNRHGDTNYFSNNLTGIIEEGSLVRAWGTQRDITERKQDEETRARLAAIVESSDDAIIGKTLDGIITSWNLGAQKIYGYVAEEVLGKPITILVPPERLDEIPQILQSIGQGEAIDHYETKRIAKDGRLLDVSLTISPIKDSAGNIVGASTVARNVTERKRAEEALREVREAERSKIARDLHDGPLQDLTYALAEAQLTRMLSKDQQLNARLEQEIAALKRAGQGLRSAVYDLRLEESAQRSVVSSVEDLVDLNRTMGQGRYEVELIVEEGFPHTLPGRLGTELVRIIQEALNNARRHSEAKNIRVVLGLEGNVCWAEVEDDGRGFEPSSPRRGVGTSSMRERAEAFGGEVEVKSEPGKGTRVQVRLPFRQDQEE